MKAEHAITIFAVDDPDASAAFYERAFGWERGADFPGVWVELVAAPGHHLGLYVRSGFASQTGRPAPPAPPADSITAAEIYVIVDDLDEAIDRLRAAGAEEISPRADRPWGDEAAYFRDPDGNVVAVATPHEPD